MSTYHAAQRALLCPLWPPQWRKIQNTAGMCIWLIHLAIQQKLTQQCKAAILQLRKIAKSNIDIIVVHSYPIWSLAFKFYFSGIQKFKIFRSQIALPFTVYSYFTIIPKIFIHLYIYFLVLQLFLFFILSSLGILGSVL